VQKREPVRVFFGLQGCLVHQTADGENLP
jgi:hypothetical protein